MGASPDRAISLTSAVTRASHDRTMVSLCWRRKALTVKALAVLEGSDS